MSKFALRQMKKIALLILVNIVFFFACKKKEEKDLIDHFEGHYVGVDTQISCCDDSGHTIEAKVPVELDVKRSSKGVRIKGVVSINNFDVNYKDSTFSAEYEHDGSKGSGKFFRNDSLRVWIGFSAKLPNGHLYNVKKQ